MSGPWDRPSSDDPDAQWPSEDLGQSSGRGPAPDPATEGAPGWDDWPSAPPPPDDYLIEEPLPPSSDPWAESWTEEEADAMLRSDSGESAPPAQDRSRPAPPIQERAEAPAPTPEPVWEPQPDPGAAPEHEAEPAFEPTADTGPRVEPWSPDPDPWRFEPEPWAEPAPEPQAAEPEPEPAEAAAESRPLDREAIELPSAAAADWPARTDALPDWLADPVLDERPDAVDVDEPPMGRDAPPAAVEEPEPHAAVEPGPVEPGPVEPGPVDAEAEQARETAGPPETPAAPEEAGSFWNAILPWRAAGDSTAEAQVEPAGEPAAGSAHEDAGDDASEAEPPEHPWIEVDEPAAGPAAAAVAAEPAPPVEPRWPASVPDRDWRPEEAPALDEESADEPEPPPDEPPAFVPIGGGLTYAPPAAAPTFDPEAGPELEFESAPAPVPEPEPEAEPEPAAASAWDEPEPEPEPALDPWAGESRPDAGESTRVLPTDWSPTPSEPPPTGALEPTAGPIRIRLAQPDAEELEESEAAPTIAEQAVPWLIGVILLLAGMVIVLLALIFAGDGSLGGAGLNPSPSPALVAVPPPTSPSATPTPTPTATTDASATPEPTSTAEPLPEYGPLEMVYQGRAAALAPIYLLRRDFTVNDEPAILAQDGDFDVRRFTWAPDGRVGAGLLADFLVSVEPGEEKRRLGDGLSTITFGDDASTVYAVQITEEGTTDTASVLAIDFASGDTEELASVGYERPELGDEAALSEARFSDDGGAVRLYWMSDDTLRLWVLGAGAWTIDAAGGEPTKLEGGPLPTLLSPNGRERISIDEDDGVTTLTRRDLNDRRLASTEIEGMVSHVRWAPSGDRIVFTLGRSAPGGGVLQDLFLWDLEDGEPPMQLTNTGAAFGAEWLGTQPRWAN